MTGNGRSSIEDQILTAIDFGHLSYDETERRLQQLTDLEVNQTERPADPVLLDACYDLLLQMHTHGSIAFQSNQERNWKQVQTRMSKTKKRLTAWRIIAIPVVALLLLWAGSIPGFDWLNIASTPDEQQYMVQGYQITAQMIETAIAEHEGVQLYHLENPTQIAEYLGFEPAIPNALSDQWHIAQCSLAFFPDFIQIKVNYESAQAESNRLIYSLYYFCNAENAHLSFEQSAEGEYMTINGCEVYISDNEGRLTCALYSQLSMANVSGILRKDELLELLPSLTEGLK